MDNIYGWSQDGLFTLLVPVFSDVVNCSFNVKIQKTNKRAWRRRAGVVAPLSKARVTLGGFWHHGKLKHPPPPDQFTDIKRLMCQMTTAHSQHCREAWFLTAGAQNVTRQNKTTKGLLRDSGRSKTAKTEPNKKKKTGQQANSSKSQELLRRLWLNPWLKNSYYFLLQHDTSAVELSLPY